MLYGNIAVFERRPLSIQAAGGAAHFNIRNKIRLQRRTPARSLRCADLAGELSAPIIADLTAAAIAPNG